MVQFKSGGFDEILPFLAGISCEADPASTSGDTLPIAMFGTTASLGISAGADPADIPGETCSKHSSCAVRAFRKQFKRSTAAFAGL
jgi:hypothetical protein